MRIDPTDAAAVETLSIEKIGHFGMFGGVSFGKCPQKRKHLIAIAQCAASKFPNDEGMNQHISITEKRLQTPVSATKMVNPNGGIDENHATRSDLRRLTGFKRGSVPPSFARRRALSRAMSASSPRRTRAVFFETPVNPAARRSREASTFSVVRIYAL